MQFRIEGLALRLNRDYLEPRQGVGKHLQGQLNTLAHRLDRRIISIGQLQAALKTIDDRQQIIGKTLQRKLVRLLHILLGTATRILHISRRPQSLILSGSQLFFQTRYARGKIAFGRRNGLIDHVVLILQIRSLFLCHVFLLS